MSKWSAQTKQRLVLLALGTTAVVGAIWFLVVMNLRTQLINKANQIEAVRSKLNVTRSGIKLAEKYHVELSRTGSLLGNYETLMAEGDLLRWVIKTLRPLQAQYDVNADFTPPQIGELNIPPKVPYKAATYTVVGKARFHEFGSFLAELENSSPFIRVKSLSLEATSSGIASANRSDKLTFKLEFSMLIRQKPVSP
jgi:hypothetical protein